MSNYKKKNQEYWNRYHRINNEGVLERICTSCNEWKEENYINFYYKNKSKPELGFQSECRICGNKRASKNQSDNKERKQLYDKKLYKEKTDYYFEKAYRSKEKDPERYKLTQALWRKLHPDRCNFYSRKHQTHRVSEKEWYECKKFFNFRCACCGMTWEDHYELFKEDLHKDHLYHNGRNDLKNCIPLCKTCNTSKHQDTINEWYNPSNPNYTYERYYQIYLWIRFECLKYVKKKRIPK